MAFFVTLVDGTQMECGDDDDFSIGEHSGVLTITSQGVRSNYSAAVWRSVAQEL